MLSELKIAVRSLGKSPGYSAVALATLALGIGVNTAMFSVVDTLLFRSAPYPEPERLVMLAGRTRSGETRSFSEQEIREIRPAVSGLSSLTTFSRGSFTMAEPGRPAERIGGLGVSAEMLDTLRVQPVLGRIFSPEEFAPGKNQVVLLTEAFWQSRFGGDRNVIGRTLRLDGDTVTIVGVMPAGTDYNMLWGHVGLWRPINFTRDQVTYRAYRSFQLIGRLKPGVAAASIGVELGPVAATQEKAFPSDYPGLGYRALPLADAVMDDVGRGISWMLLGLSGFILLIACANLANLQLARATASIREFAIRAALGASRARLIAQQLAESLVLAVAGGALGIVVALWVNSLLEANILIDGVPGLRIPLDAGVLAATLLVSLLTGVVFGVVPALFASRTDVNTALKAQSRGATSGRGHHRLRQVLIVGEVALALVLLGGAAIMNRGFDKFLHRETGWDTGHVLTASVPMPENRFDSPAKRIEFYRQLQTRLAALPGVDRVALSTSLPLWGYGSERPVFVDAPAPGAAQNPGAAHAMIAGDYFAAMGIPVLEGRTFPPDLTADSPEYVIVNERLARKFWPHDSAVGKRLGVVENNTSKWREIVGVVADVQAAANFTEEETRLHVYRPLVQEPWSFVNLVVRSEHPEALADAVRRAVTDVDADLPADELGTVRQFVNRTQHNLVVVGQILVGFAALGLVLAAVGLYGVISNLVAQRTTEFGIRIALGAAPGDLLGDVLGRGLRLTLIGLVIGLAGAYGLGRFLGSIMPRLASPDAPALATVAVVLLAVALTACWLPARRAARVNPIDALRAE